MPSSLKVSSSVASQLESLIQPAVASKQTPPYFFKAVSAEGTLAEFNYGKDANGNDITSDLPIRIHSMTKMITSIAALQLVDRGLISLDTEIGQYLPGLANPLILKGFTDGGEPILEEAKTKITLTMLLNHTTGLSGIGDWPDFARYRKLKGLSSFDWDDSVEQYYDSQQILRYDPGSSYQYSSSTDFVGRLICVLSGSATLEDYFQENILRPLKMSSTSFLCPPELRQRMTLPIAWRPSSPPNAPVQKTPPTDGSFSDFYLRVAEPLPDAPKIQRGGGGLISTVNDYTALLRHLLRLKPGAADGVKEGEWRVLGEKGYEAMWKGTQGEEARYALGAHKPGPNGGAGSGDQDWSAGGLCLNNMDWEGRRKAGSGYWAGLSNILFFIDPTTGVAMMGGTQCFPVDDETIENVWVEAQKIVYAGLEEAQDVGVSSSIV